VRRREFITLLGGAAGWPLMARAQQPAKKMLRVGTVSATQQSSPQWGAFLQRMAELGYHEGKTFAFDFIPAANEEGYETGYRTLVAREPDIVMATGVEIALKSALAATRTLPIVMIAIDYDPFARGACVRSSPLDRCHSERPTCSRSSRWSRWTTTAFESKAARMCLNALSLPERPPVNLVRR
jgi:hypothetical protein